MYIQKSVKEYLAELGARQPTPGGGSASALSGATGIALLEMVCNFTLGSKKYKEVERDISEHLDSLKKMRGEFTLLIDEDAKIYSAICGAFKTKDEKTIDKALKDGYHISVKICRLSKNAMKIASDIAQKGNVNLITDVGCGAELLKATFNSGVFNARINLKGIKDAPFVNNGDSELKKLQKEIDGLHLKTIDKVNERMS